MRHFQTEFLLDTEAVIRASNSEAARQTWAYLVGTSLDLGDPLWTKSCEVKRQIRLANTMRFRAPLTERVKTICEASVLRQVAVAPTSAKLLVPQPCRWSDLNSYNLRVSMRVKVLIRKKTLEEATKSLHFIETCRDKIPIDLEEAREYWLSPLGLDSEALPLVFARHARLGAMTDLNGT
jgi:hypothetical protein